MKKFLIILLIAMLTFSFTGCGALLVGSALVSDDDDDNENTTSTVDTYLNQRVTNKSNVSFTVTKILNTQQIGTGSFAKTTTSNFIKVTVQIYNGGSEAWSASPLNFTLMRGTAEYDYHTATYYLEDEMSSLNDINPGLTKTYSVVYETPTMSTTKDYVLKISDNYLSSDYVYVNLWNKNGSLDNITIDNGSEGEQDNPTIVEYNIGDEFTFDDLKITIIEWKFESVINGFYSAKEGYKWINVKIKIENPTSSTKTLSSKYTDYILYDESAKYLDKYWNEDPFIKSYSSIMALDTKTGILAYLVPEAVSTGTGSLCFNFTFNTISDRDTIIRVWLRK